MVAGRGHVVSGGAEPGDDQKVAAVDQDLPYEIAPVEHHLRPLLAADQPLRQQNRDLEIAVERHVAAGADDIVDIIRTVDPVGEKAGEPQHVLGDRAHRHLPRIELAELAAHRHQEDAAETAIAQQRKHIDAIADAARLHQERRALAAERGAGDEADAFLLGRQHHVGDSRVVAAERDEPAMAGVGHIADLTHADAAEMAVDRVGP